MEKADLNYNESPIERKIARKKYKGSKIFLNNQKTYIMIESRSFLLRILQRVKLHCKNF